MLRRDKERCGHEHSAVFRISARRYRYCSLKNQVSRSEIQKFVGALQGKKDKKGVFITTSTFTENTKIFVSNIESKIVLIDGN